MVSTGNSSFGETSRVPASGLASSLVADVAGVLMFVVSECSSESITTDKAARAHVPHRTSCPQSLRIHGLVRDDPVRALVSSVLMEVRDKSHSSGNFKD